MLTQPLPDILVLGGGGRQGDAWLTGILAGIEDGSGIDLRTCGCFLGTSAGAVVAARLTAGEALARPLQRPHGASAGPSSLRNWLLNSAMTIASPPARIGLQVTTGSGARARAWLLKSLPNAGVSLKKLHDAVDAGGASFDGRLRIVAVERTSGKRVVFGAPGGPPATVAQAVTASCSLPLLFAPTTIDGREYVDGAVWSPSNADVAPVDRDARVLLISPMASRHGPLQLTIRAAAATAALVEASALRGRGATVRVITPDRESGVFIGRDVMSQAGLQQTLTVAYRQGLQL